MDPNTPMTLAAAAYKTRPEAVEAFKTVWAARHQGQFDHMALAVLTKDEDGQLQVERHDSTAKHVAWTGVAVGAALLAICTATGTGGYGRGAHSPQTHRVPSKPPRPRRRR